jgi:predicted membrane protein
MIQFFLMIGFLIAGVGISIYAKRRLKTVYGDAEHGLGWMGLLVIGVLMVAVPIVLAFVYAGMWLMRN